MPWFGKKAGKLNQDMKSYYSTSKRQIVLKKPAKLVQRPLDIPGPISKLPPEILGFIFHIYMEGKTRAIPPLILVCKAWRHVALHTPELWTTITIKIALEPIERRDQSHQIKLCIENSGCLPLHLDFDAGGMVDPGRSQYHLRNLKRDISNAFFELKKQNDLLSERWRSWRISLPCKYGGLIIGPDIAVLLNMPAPNLVRVLLRNLIPIPRGSWEQPAVLSQHASLRQLLIDESGFSNIPDSVNTLKYLEIEINLGPLFALTQLQRFRSLNILIIQRPSSDSFLILLHGTLKLSQLRVLSLGNAMEFGESTSLDFPVLHTLCIRSGRPNQASLPHLTPIRLAWAPTGPFFKLHGTVTRYLQLLLATYQYIEHLVLPGGIFRPLFDLLLLQPLLPLSLTSVSFDNGLTAPSSYHIVNGQLEPVSQTSLLDECDWRGSFS